MHNFTRYSDLRKSRHWCFCFYQWKLNIKVLKLNFERHLSLQVSSLFSQNELFLPLIKDISRRIQSFELNFLGLLDFTGLSDKNAKEGICRRTLRIEFIKINVSQFRSLNFTWLSELSIFKSRKIPHSCQRHQLVICLL